MLIANKVGIFCSLCLLSGCLSLSNKEQSQDLITTPVLNRSIQNSLATPFFTLGEWPEKEWWHVFNSAQLDALIQTALLHNPSLQSVEKRVEEAKQLANIANSKLFPLIFFKASDNWQYLSQHGLYRALNPTLPLKANMMDMTLAFTYEFDFWSKHRNQFKAALGRERAEEAAAVQAKLIVATAVAQAFFALKTNLVKMELAQQLHLVHKNLFELQNLLFSNALSSQMPIDLAEENLLESAKMVDEIEKQVAQDRYVVNLFIGHGPDSPLTVDKEFSSLPATLVIPENLSINLLSRRPDLMAQIWSVEALAHEIGVARANYFPNINLFSFLGLESISLANFFSLGSGKTGLSPAMNLPLYTAGEIQATIDSKRAQFDCAVFEYNELLLKGCQEIADLMAFAQSVYKQQAKQATIVSRATNRYELTQLRMLNGLDNAFKLYTLEEELIQKKIANLDLIYGQYVAMIKLIKALGGGYTSDFIPIEKGAS